MNQRAAKELRSPAWINGQLVRTEAWGKAAGTLCGAVPPECGAQEGQRGCLQAVPGVANRYTANINNNKSVRIIANIK